jgi:hypothetical protein
VCDLDLILNEGQCYRPRGEGEACDPEVLYLACALPSNVCDPATSTCVRAPAPGEPCDTICLYEDEFDCLGTCLAQPWAGETCSSVGVGGCAGNLGCGVDTDTCAVKTACDPT